MAIIYKKWDKNDPSFKEVSRRNPNIPQIQTRVKGSKEQALPPSQAVIDFYNNQKNNKDIFSPYSSIYKPNPASATVAPPVQYLPNPAADEQANKFWVKIPWMNTTGVANKDVANRFQWLYNNISPDLQTYYDTMNQINAEQQGQIAQQHQLANEQYTDQTQRAKDYYGDLGSYLAKKTAEEQALAQAVWTRSGATPSQSNATLAKIQWQWVEEMAKVKWDELNQLQNMHNTYQALLSQFQEKYAGSTDKNVVQTYKDILNTVNTIKTSMYEADATRSAEWRSRAAAWTGVAGPAKPGFFTITDESWKLLEVPDTPENRKMAQDYQSQLVSAKMRTSWA